MARVDQSEVERLFARAAAQEKIRQDQQGLGRPIEALDNDELLAEYCEQLVFAAQAHPTKASGD